MTDLKPYHTAISAVLWHTSSIVPEGKIAAAFPELDDEEFDRALRYLVHSRAIRRERGYVWAANHKPIR